MRHNHEKCEDDEDASRMAEGILRQLGYVHVLKGGNALDASYHFQPVTLLAIARSAERIARWARQEAKEAH